MKSSIIKITTIFFLLYGHTVAQTVWPVGPQNQQGNINGTIGEYRESTNNGVVTYRFHNGVDIVAPNTSFNGTVCNGCEVYATNAGTFIWHASNSFWQQYGQIGDVKYFHIDFIVGNGQPVAVGDLIGRMRTDGPIHLHYQIGGDILVNPFVSNLIPFQDLTVPIIQSHSFYRNGLLKSTATAEANSLLLSSTINFSGNEYTLVHNKIDIATNAFDTRLNSAGGDQNTPNNRVGLYQLSYQVYDQNNVPIGGEQANLNFGVIRNDNALTQYVWTPGTTSTQNVNWIITSGIIPITPQNPRYDRYFNTKRRVGTVEDWMNDSNLDARHNGEAIYQDGQYNIQIRARDIDSDGNVGGGFQTAYRNAYSLVDNFRPYISRVTVKQNNSNGAPVYTGRWEWNQANSSLNFYPENFNDVRTTDNIWIEILASEPLQSLSINIPNADGATYRTVNPVTGSNNKTFIITYSPIAIGGVQQINFQGTDYAGNGLERMQTNTITNIPTRQADGTWTVSDPGVDNRHAFNIGTNTCSSNSGGRSGSVCMLVDFIASTREGMLNTPVLFTNETSGGSGTLTYSWNFGSGASPATASTIGPHSVSYSTTGTKTVSLTVTDAIGPETITKTNYVNISATAPTVDFTATPTSGNTPLTVNYSGSSSGSVSSWSWSFPGGSPSSSTIQNPSVVYTSSGNYSASLTINGSSSITKSGIVSVNTVTPLAATISHCNNYYFVDCSSSYNQYDGIYFTANVLGGSPFYNFLWNFGDGNTSTSYEPLHIYSSPGTYGVTVTVTDTKGASTLATTSVTVATITPTITANFTMSDNYITAGEGPIVFTDATTSNINMSSATYYWDFGDGAYPQYAYTKGPHSVCYDDYVNNKTIFLRVHDPIKYVTDEESKNAYVAVGNMSACASTVPRWETTQGAAAGGAVQNCLWPGQNVGIINGGLTQLNCDITNTTIRNCVFNPSYSCFNGNWYSSHGTVSMRTDHSNSFRLWSGASYSSSTNTLYRSSEGIFYQHSENFKPGKRYIFTFYAAVSGYDPFRTIDHLRVSLTNGLLANTSCVETGSNYALPSYSFSMHQLGSFEYAVNTTVWHCYEVYFYPPNNNFNQIWIYPEVEGHKSSQQRDEWILIDDFSLRVGDVSDCAPDIVVTTSSPGKTQSGITLETQGTVTIPNSQSTTYRAGESIVLNPGFSSLSGSLFKAQIGACDLSSGRTRDSHVAEAPVFDDFDLFSLNYKKASQAESIVEPGARDERGGETCFIVPNPSKDNIKVYISLEHTSPVEIVLMNIKGQIVEKKELPDVTNVAVEFFVGHLQQGVYLVLIKSLDGTRVEQFVKI